MLTHLNRSIVIDLETILREEMEKIRTELENGNCDIDRYKFLTGRLSAIREFPEWINEATKKAENN